MAFLLPPGIKGSNEFSVVTKACGVLQKKTGLIFSYFALCLGISFLRDIKELLVYKTDGSTIPGM